MLNYGFSTHFLLHIKSSVGVGAVLIKLGELDPVSKATVGF